jgi:hypothetical protein
MSRASRRDALSRRFGDEHASIVAQMYKRSDRPGYNNLAISAIHIGDYQRQHAEENRVDDSGLCSRAGGQVESVCRSKAKVKPIGAKDNRTAKPDQKNEKDHTTTRAKTATTKTKIPLQPLIDLL